MSQTHNKWLAWKMKHGLATRGPVGIDKFHPRGLFSGIVYKLYFRKRDPNLIETGPEVFAKSVGGVVGAVGKTNGE